MHAMLIVNPRSGRSNSEVVAALRARAEELGVEFRVTERAGHAADLAREAVEAGAETVISAGGDDSLREAAAVLYGTRVALGVVPLGTCNNVAVSLELPADPVQALNAAMLGRIQPVDVGELVGHGFFIESASVGVSAEAWRRGGEASPEGFLQRFLTTLGATVGALLDVQPLELDVDFGCHQVRLDAVEFTVANLPLFGPGLAVAPNALATDGRLDVCILTTESRLELLSAITSLLRGEHSAVAVYLTADQVTVESAEPLAVRVDNTLIEGLHRAVFRCLPGHLCFRLPQSAADAETGR